MVTQTNKDFADSPYISLDFEKIARERTHSPDEVRGILEDRIRKTVDTPEEPAENSRETKKDLLNQAKDSIKDKSARKELELFDKDPELYTTLYALKENTNSESHTANPGTERERETDKADAKICLDANGKLFLAIDSLKPTDVSFQVHDGKLTFNPAGMSPDQLKDLLAWLEHRGLAVDLDSLKLENADQKTEEMFAGAKEDLKKDRGHGEEFAHTEGAKKTLTVDEEQDENNENLPPVDENANVNGQRANEPIDFNGASGKAAPGAYKSAVDSITAWMNKNKRKNYSYFTYNRGGYTVFAAFPTENPNNLKEDGVVDKDGNISFKNECKLYVKRNKDGKVEISFSTPNGKPLTDAYADLIINAHKDAGNTRVKFGTMSDANEGAIRAACGRGLVVPVGLKLSQTKFDKMIDAAEGKNGKNNPKVIKYRRDLAMQFAYQLEQKGIDWQDPKNKNDVDCRCIRSAIGAYNLSPFRDWWEDFGLRGEYERIVKSNGSGANKSNGAAASIGAAEAVAKLYNAFNEGLDSSGNAALPAEQRGTVGFLVSDQCQTLSAKEKEEFRSFIAGRENLPIRDLPPEAAKRLFNIMQKTEEEIAKNKIEEEYKRLVNDKYYKGNAEWDAVSGFLSDAQTRANNVAEDIKDTGLPPILICRIGNPKHDFSAIKKEMERTERRDRNHDDDYDRRRDNRDRDDRNDDRRDRDDRRNRSNGGNNYPNGGRRQGYDR